MAYHIQIGGILRSSFFDVVIKGSSVGKTTITLLNEDIMKSTVFAVVMKKGGVGKTTITLNISEALALCGFKVLCIDNDEQHNLSNVLGVKIGKVDVSDLYNGIVSPGDFIQKGIYKTRVDNLDCVPCSIKISNTKFKDRMLLNNFICMTKYDYVFIDCAPGSGLTQNEIALLVADFFILPTLLKQFSLTGLSEMIAIVTGGLGRSMDQVVIIPNDVDISFHGKIKINKHREFIKALNVMFPENITETMIPHDEMLDDMVTSGKSIFLHRFRSSKAAKCFLQLIFELFPINEDEVYERVMKKRALHKSNQARDNYFKNKLFNAQEK